MQGGISPCLPDSHTVVSPDDGHTVAHTVEIDKYTKNKLCTKLALFTRLCRDAWSTKHNIWKRRGGSETDCVNYLDASPAEPTDAMFNFLAYSTLNFNRIQKKIN